jgi:hypothetical protein
MMKFPSSPSPSPSSSTTPRTSRQTRRMTPRTSTPRKTLSGAKRRPSTECVSRDTSSPPLTPPDSSRSSVSSSTVSGFVLGRRTSEYATRTEQLQEVGRLLGELLAADAPDTASARLGACVMLLRAETTAPGQDAARTVAAPAVPVAQADVQFHETVGNALVTGGAVLRCEVSATPRPRNAMQICCGRGAWQCGEANGIVSFTFKILNSKLGDGGRMRLGIVAQNDAGRMGYALWLNP